MPEPTHDAVPEPGWWLDDPELWVLLAFEGGLNEEGLPIHAHRRSRGFCRSIELAVLLVAEHRQVEDVWLLHEAVYASFDTWGILPHRLLYAAGIERTRRYVATSDHPRQGSVLDELSRITETTDERVEQLLADRRSHYRHLIEEGGRP
ncbi:hypothetical protein [Nonomuraea zeae]|uniref:Uncharacterized protein n=1 Tax=Nonomuraea zeae TaxID=1642303 RepID=A0A5S4F9M2_9ACTN|nr:hypothetical protein [Nonomuraea zeae]TMR13864.1 hypothetical protein ETD85_57320 [Nonomuraea zeae]